MLEVTERLQARAATEGLTGKEVLRQLLGMMGKRLGDIKRVTEDPTLPSTDLPEVPTLQDQPVEGRDEEREPPPAPSFGREPEGQRPPSAGRNKMPLSPQGPAPAESMGTGTSTAALDEAQTFAMPASSSGGTQALRQRRRRRQGPYRQGQRLKPRQQT